MGRPDRVIIQPGLAAGDSVVAKTGLLHEAVSVLATQKCVRAITTIDDIIPRAAVDGIGARSAKDKIIARFAKYPVITDPAGNRIIAGAGVDGIVARPRIDGVVASARFDQIIVARMARQDRIVAIDNIAVRVTEVAVVDDVISGRARYRAIGKRDANRIEVERVVGLCRVDPDQCDGFAVREGQHGIAGPVISDRHVVGFHRRAVRITRWQVI